MIQGTSEHRSALASDSQWPGLSQVFQLERARTNALGETEREVHDGITSLPASAGTLSVSWNSFENIRALRMDDTSVEIGPFRKISRNCARVTHLICLLYSTTRQLASSLVKAKPTFPRPNAPLPINSTVL